MDEASVKFMWEAAEKLEALDGVLDRARDGAGPFHDEARELQHHVQSTTRRAIALARRMEAEGEGKGNG